MKVLLYGVLLLLAHSLQAASIDVYASINVGDPSNILARGTAQYLDDNLEPAVAGLSGNVTLFEGDAYDVQFQFSDYWPWISYSGLWADEFSHFGDYAWCYQSATAAHTFDVAEQLMYTPRGCTVPPPFPREPHGFNICPIILDLDGGGVPTSGLEDAVAFFDVNGDAVREASGWTARGTEDAFLWRDVNGNGGADPGELFGSTMVLPDGSIATNGFQALRAFDSDLDGKIDRNDRVWGDLRLWVDRDHDGRSSPRETTTLGGAHVLHLDLNAARIHGVDVNGNTRMFRSTYARRDPKAQNGVVTRSMVDIAFIEQQ